jgi:hypothetical protein
MCQGSVLTESICYIDALIVMVLTENTVVYYRYSVPYGNILHVLLISIFGVVSREYQIFIVGQNQNVLGTPYLVLVVLFCYLYRKAQRKMDSIA